MFGKAKMQNEKKYNCSESPSRFALCLLTSQGDSFSNKVNFLKFNFGNWSKFPKQNVLFPFAEVNLFFLSQHGINFYLLELLLCLVGNTVQENHMSLLYDLSFPAEGSISISWCVTFIQLTGQCWCNMKDAVQLSEEEDCSSCKSVSHKAALQLWWTEMTMDVAEKRFGLTLQSKSKYFRIK